VLRAGGAEVIGAAVAASTPKLYGHPQLPIRDIPGLPDYGCG
jgi:hypothetical protein